MIPKAKIALFRSVKDFLWCGEPASIFNAKSPGPFVRSSGFQPRVKVDLSVPPRVNHLISLSFSFLICKMLCLLYEERAL